ncbi:MAG: 50S ribosomal protein L9 [Nitratireductor sp.]|nr:50S ribosomal protein L9 [Nitratireductor sp.]
MQVILLERIAKLGQMGDTVNVKDGYARNYLLPTGKALRANEANKAKFETQRVELEARNLERKKEADSVNEKLNGTSYVVVRSAGETGQLYGSVSTRDIATALDEAGFKVARSQVSLQNPIKTIGLHTVEVVLHPEVTATVTVNVARSEDEAERQAAGEDLSNPNAAFEADEADDLDLDEIFDNPEDAEAAEDDGEASQEEQA